MTVSSCAMRISGVSFPGPREGTRSSRNKTNDIRVGVAGLETTKPAISAGSGMFRTGSVGVVINKYPGNPDLSIAR